MASMLAGSQVVHNFYKPLENLDVLVEEYQKQKSEMDVGEFLRLKRRAAQPGHAATSAADSSVDWMTLFYSTMSVRCKKYDQL